MVVDILQTIAERTRHRVARCRASVPLEQLIDQAGSDPAAGRDFEQALRSPGISFIGEIKRASPSKGLIAPDFPYLQIAQEYAAADVAAISVLTEPEFFQGDDLYLSRIAQVVTTPLLRKDFTVDPYMIYQAHHLGAAAVLLICAILSPAELAAYLHIADRLGLAALVETHDETEVAMALAAGAKIIGVNHRDLKTFTVDLGVSERLRSLVPASVLFVAESGISTPGDIARLRDVGVDAVLIGETIMTSPDKSAMIARLRGDEPGHGDGERVRPGEWQQSGSRTESRSVSS